MFRLRPRVTRVVTVLAASATAALLAAPALGASTVTRFVKIPAHIVSAYTPAPGGCSTYTFAVFKTVAPKPPKVQHGYRIAGLDKTPVLLEGNSTRDVPGGGGPQTVPVAGNKNSYADKSYEQLTQTTLRKNTHTFLIFSGGDETPCAQTPERQVKWKMVGKLSAQWFWVVKHR